MTTAVTRIYEDEMPAKWRLDHRQNNERSPKEEKKKKIKNNCVANIQLILKLLGSDWSTVVGGGAIRPANTHFLAG